MEYHKNIIWHPVHDELVRTVFSSVMGYRLHKNPRVNKIDGRHMIGTGKMTKEKEKKLRKLLGSKVKMTSKVPMFGWGR